jgi:ATP-dependent DNA helicase RecQ
VRRDATEDARKLLSCIYRCQQAGGFGFASTHIIDVLRGKQTEKTQKFGHGKLSTFGIGADVPEAQWRLLLRQLIALHLVEVDYARFNVLRLTDASRAVLKGEQRIELRQHVAAAGRKPRKSKTAATTELSSADGTLFEKLRAWRAQIAREHGVPAYVVLHDNTLRAIAHRQPQSFVELRSISGIGEKKLERYGAEILAVVSRPL